MNGGRLAAGWGAGIPETPNPLLQDLIAPHIDSFNFAVGEGLVRAVQDLDPVLITNPTTEESLTLWLDSVEVGLPAKKDDSSDSRLFPHECREGGFTYRAPVTAQIATKLGDGEVVTQTRRLGYIPIMVGTRKCHLNGMAPKDLVRHKEEATELGGYFIINGLERLIRMLVIARRNFPLAVSRPSFKKRGPRFSQHGILIRSVRPDETNGNNVLHYMNDGSCMYAFAIQRQQYFIPVTLLLRALKDTADREIFERIVQGDVDNTFLTDRVELLLSEHHSQFPSALSRQQSLAYLGNRFRVRLDVPASVSDEAVGEELIRKYILVHLDRGMDKFLFMILIIQKLYALVSGQIRPDSVDSQIYQEVLQTGHIYLMVLKDKLREWLQSVRRFMQRDMDTKAADIRLSDNVYVSKCMDRGGIDVGQKIDYFIATGNLVSEGLGLQQTAGFTVVAEKLNYLRYLSHFRSIHRGQVFTEMKTTSVRRLLPEAWGFFCPVHTPDGAPCGLLNHLSSKCTIVNDEEDTSALPHILASLGMNPDVNAVFDTAHFPVCLDGKLLGWIPGPLLDNLERRLRHLKAQQTEGIPKMLEIVSITPSLKHGGSFPSLFLFCSRSRMMRPVQYLPTGAIEYIGTFEQESLHVACEDVDILPSVTRHQEVKPQHIISVVANLTPFSDLNQSPRNMYQCQMCKQTIGTPCHSFPHRSDNKMYRIQTPQLPITRTEAQFNYGVDNYPHGTNAVVAVISYTGYDMEDAMIINKSAYERGFAHGTVYTTTIVSLEEKRGNGNISILNNTIGGLHGDGQLFNPGLDPDGLPPIGTQLQQGDPFYCVLDMTTGQHKIVPYKYAEPSVVDLVRVVNTGGTLLQKANIKLRFNRNPVIGDKFASRHGQKGVLSQLWPQENMPFAESGITPDVIINPHAFPSRMTIGMLIESMAGKSGALQGFSQDATSFRFNEKNRAVDYFGKELRQAGFNYLGNEKMISGITGEEFHADIFLGIVYYQRLRHMVKDKFQVRSTGPVHNLTRQPIKGRKKGGGIRFGEMERDSLLAHGTAYLLQDRLFNCSDAHDTFACSNCGSLMSPLMTRLSGGSSNRRPKGLCLYCNTAKHLVQIRIPYVFKFLANEMMAMNLRMFLNIQQSN